MWLGATSQGTTEMSEKRNDEDLRRLREVCQQLGEHFDSVQVFCTRHESGELGGTVNVQYGAGNWFARYGIVECWLVKEKEAMRVHARQSEE
jgi:hypothetical protein